MAKEPQKQLTAVERLNERAKDLKFDAEVVDMIVAAIGESYASGYSAGSGHKGYKQGFQDGYVDGRDTALRVRA